ncbi:MAG: ribosome biogenesis GTP-binding protein YihA/YsxC [Bdellovibrionales bacterium]
MPAKLKGPVDYIKSAVFPADYPQTSLPEIAFAGRSNAGKSSLINGISDSKIANVSQAPGKTRLLSFFNVRQKYILVDMPGYGFSKRSGDEQSTWEKMVETYIEKREQLKGLILVMDARRDWTEEEELLKRYLERSGLPMAIALTKTDKLSKSEIFAATRRIQKRTGISALFPVSNLKRSGIEEIEEYLYRHWVRESE